jgi:hypothetical protein
VFSRAGFIDAERSWHMVLRELKSKQAKKNNLNVCIKVWYFEKVVNKTNRLKFKSLAINRKQRYKSFL